MLAPAAGPNFEGSRGNKYLSQSPRLLNVSPYNPIHILPLVFLCLLSLPLSTLLRICINIVWMFILRTLISTTSELFSASNIVWMLLVSSASCKSCKHFKELLFLTSTLTKLRLLFQGHENKQTQLIYK